MNFGPLTRLHIFIDKRKRKVFEILEHLPYKKKEYILSLCFDNGDRGITSYFTVWCCITCLTNTKNTGLVKIKIQRNIVIIFLTIVFNPFKPNEISHYYQLDQSISALRVVGWYFSF